jgi:hypothetical protein
MGKPSGKAATAKAIEVLMIKTHSLPCKKPVPANSNVRISVSHIRVLLSAFSFLSQGVVLSFVPSTSEVMVPNSVCCAIAVITTFAFPFITEVPLKTMLSLSPSGVSLCRDWMFFF